MTISFENRLHNASRTAAQALTRDIRDYLVSLGWPPQAASAVSIDYEMNDFKVDISGQYADDANVLEYGSQVMRPTAAIRKFFNRDENIHGRYFALIEKALGELV
jgi:hypothetical protein